MNNLQRGIILLSCVTAILGGCSCGLTRKLLYFPAPVSRERLDYLRKAGGSLQELFVPARDGITLHGWLIAKDLERLPTILYFGGNAEEVSANIEPFSLHLNTNIALINYRGYGLSGGKPKEELLYSDAEKIYDYILAMFPVRPDNIIVMGRSLGSGIAVDLAVKRGIAKSVLITPYDSIEDVASSILPSFLVKMVLSDKFRAIDIADRLQGSVLLLVAGKDEVISPSHARRLNDVIKCQKQMIVIENATHNDIGRYPEYWKQLSLFLS